MQPTTTKNESQRVKVGGRVSERADASAMLPSSADSRFTARGRVKVVVLHAARTSPPPPLHDDSERRRVNVDRALLPSRPHARSPPPPRWRRAAASARAHVRLIDAANERRRSRAPTRAEQSCINQPGRMLPKCTQDAGGGSRADCLFVSCAPATSGRSLVTAAMAATAAAVAAAALLAANAREQEKNGSV